MSIRQCGPCTACCDGWLTSEKMKLKPGSACQHCTAGGCGIYDSRPVNPCISFKCAWLKEKSPLTDDMRPDLCGAIVMLDRRWKGIPVITAVPTGENIPKNTLARLRLFASKNGIPLVFSSNVMKHGEHVKTIKTGFGPPDFVKAVSKSIGSDDITRFQYQE